MPVYSCGDEKYKWGENGRCIYKSREQARRAGIAIEINKKKKMIKDILLEESEIDIKFKKLKDLFNINF